MNLLLLDADVIIDLYELGLWEQIARKNAIYVPAIVINEVNHYDDESGRHNINLKEQVNKTIQEISATATEINALKNKLIPTDSANLDAGEAEAITILDKNPNMIFCSSDHYAVVTAVHCFKMENRIISVETLLKKSGLSINKLKPKSSENRFQSYVQEGKLRRIQTTNLS